MGPRLNRGFLRGGCFLLFFYGGGEGREDAIF